MRTVGLDQTELLDAGDIKTTERGASGRLRAPKMAEDQKNRFLESIRDQTAHSPRSES